MPARYPPQDCPEGFLSRHFVISGETMSIISQYYGTTKEVLIEVNPHIADPNVLYPGMYYVYLDFANLQLAQQIFGAVTKLKMAIQCFPLHVSSI